VFVLQLTKARHAAGLVPKKITVHRDGKPVLTTVWVRPEEAATEQPKGVQFDLFAEAGEQREKEERSRATPPGLDEAKWKSALERADQMKAVSANMTPADLQALTPGERTAVEKLKRGEVVDVAEELYRGEHGAPESPKPGEAEAAAEAAQPEPVIPEPKKRKPRAAKQKAAAEPQAEVSPVEAEARKIVPPAVEVEPASASARGLDTPISKTEFRDYGSWAAKGRGMTPDKRNTLNQNVARILMKPGNEITEEEIVQIRQYSGFGGVKAEDERGVLYDYYTSPPVAKMTWQMLDKLAPIKEGATVLEPSCGTGVFFDVAPEGMKLTGVELDPRTASAAAILQPKAKVHNMAFEQFNLFNIAEFDHVVGNAPFGERPITTGFMDMPGEKSLDRYFIERSIDSVKDGGTVALIVHPGVLRGKSHREWRENLSKKAQFMGAVKLPTSSFKHTHTAVSPDILFFRKLPQEARDILASMDTAAVDDAGFIDHDWTEGNYYDSYPDNYLGEKARGNFGQEIAEGELTPEKMDKAVKAFQAKPDLTTKHLDALRKYAEAHPAEKKAAPSGMKPTEMEAAAIAEKTLQVGMTKTVDGVIYRLNANHRWERVDGDAIVAAKVDALKAISANVKAIRDAMHNQEPVDVLQAQTRELMQNYADTYGSKHGEDEDVKKWLKKNAATEGVFEAMATAADSDIVTKQNVFDKYIEIKDGHQPDVEALSAIAATGGTATEERIRKDYPNRADELIGLMYANKDVFLDTDGAWKLREDFVVGNAYEKMDALKAAIEKETDAKRKAKLQAGHDTLYEAIGWVPIEDADIKPYSRWIPEDILNRWITSESGLDMGGSSGMGGPQVRWDEDEQKWSSSNSQLERFFNLQKQREKGVDTDVYNRNMEDNFKAFLAVDTEARGQVEDLYNRLFNAELGVPTKVYPIALEGWNNDKYTLRPWQWQTIHHLYRSGKGISALGVGFGKTLGAIGLMALLRQEGKAKRPFLQVPNNKVKDWMKEISEAMPGLKIGAVDPETKGYGDRDKRYAMYQELANGDYDVIILPESSASEIQLREENDKEITDRIVTSQLPDVSENSKKSQRDKEKAKMKAETRLESQTGAKNVTINFEDFGCDAIFIDEAHNYKNLFSSSLARETGMNDGRRSERALALFKKNELIRRDHGGKGVFMLTATPLTNSPLEYYNMLMHVAPEEMERLGIKNIDGFIREFADFQEGEKYDWSTGTVKKSRILKSFKNIRAMQDMFFKYTDLQNDPEKIGLKKPKADYVPTRTAGDQHQKDAIKELAEEIEKYRAMSAEEREEAYPGQNFLTFYSRMRTASLDMELLNPGKFKGWKNPKLDRLTENIKEMLPTGAGQVVFCDRVLSGDGSLNMHDKIKAAIAAAGVPEDQIAVVNGVTKSGGAMSDKALESAVSDAIAGFNAGKYKVILGTTQTLGEGVNLQKNSAAVHHLDIPYRPSDFIQRNGRVDRQGNKQEKVKLFNYLSSGTIDNYSVGLVQGKANWIDQLLKSKSKVFMNPNDDNYIDVDGLLLALTEEFGGGDPGAAARLKAEITSKKEAATMQMHQKNVHDALTQLALMRSTVRSYEGDKGAPEFQARLRKISSLESSLQANPQFNHLDLISEKPPVFMYDKNNKRVVREGDNFVGADGTVYEVTGVDDKKGEAIIFPLGEKTKEAKGGWRNGRWTQTREVSAEIRLQKDGTFTDWNLQGEGGGKHYPVSADPKQGEKLKAVSDPDLFKTQDAAFKRANFIQLARTTKQKDYRTGVPVLMRDDQDNVQLAEYSLPKDDSSIINPFTPEGKKVYMDNADLFDEEHGKALAEIMGDPAFAKHVRMKKLAALESSPIAKKIMGLLAKHPKGFRPDEVGGSSYEVRTFVNQHPDLDFGYFTTESGESDYGIIPKEKEMEKSIDLGEMPEPVTLPMFVVRV
jgi:tRNA G10  N-methylase Trm11